MTGQPKGSRGVVLCLKGSWIYSKDKIFVLRVDCLSRLSVKLVWRISKFQKFLGKDFSMSAKLDRKCGLKVQISNSAAFIRCIWGGTNWYPYPRSAFMMSLYLVIASLSNI